MATEIGKSVERTTGVKVIYEAKGRDGHVPELRETDAVAVALVMNEIVMNAAKHGGNGAQTNVVNITARISPQRAEIAVVNRGTLPPGFDFESGSGLGTGLELVKALMPRDGASITFVGNDGYVRVVLELAPPVIARAADKIKEIRNEWDRRDRPYSDRRR
jgi:two-component sensor histidine kinase